MDQKIENILNPILKKADLKCLGTLYLLSLEMI